MKYLILALMLALCLGLQAQTAPVVSNVTALQRTDGSMIVDIWYDLFDADGDLCLVTIKISDNDGTSYDHFASFGNLSGAVGYDQQSGTSKHIVWATAAEGIRLDGNQYRIRVLADDGSSPALPANFIFVPGGTCSNGVGSVTLSSFYIDKYEVTQASWLDIMGNIPSNNNGSGANYPVYRLSWYSAIEYCNRRSIIEQITPCYSYGGYGSNPDDWPAGWNTVWENHYNVNCDWAANGYRLPTVAEWTFAAKGGNDSQGFAYSGSNVIDQVAWWSGNSDGTTHPVGSKPANELGLHDMTGNVWEWCWDMHAPLPSDPQTDPHGPDSGTCRVTRGGSFSTLIQYCTIDFHNNGGNAQNIYYNTGLRLVRISP